LSEAKTKFDRDPSLAIIALCIVDESGATARRHFSGLRPQPDRERFVTAFPGGGCVVRSSVFTSVGGLCEPFTYALEETDLAWRVIDAGHRVAFASNLKMFHPATSPSRHHDFVRLTARNRVWLVHRNLPLALALAYLMNWSIVTIFRNWSDVRSIRAHFAGTADGVRTRVGPRRPISWRTVARLSRLGRPPII
jgi:hypothetical protein